MTREETVTLTQYVKALCPQQAIDRFTPIVWHDVIGHLEFTECREAAIAASRRRAFIAPCDIIAEIAEQRCAAEPHSQACRGSDHRNCLATWCSCTCHPRAVEALTRPRPPRTPLPARTAGEPVALADAVKAVARAPGT